MSYLTNQADYELRVDIELSNGASFYTTYSGFRITDEWGQNQVTHIEDVESNAGTLISTCPTNMIYGLCSCRATCVDSNGQSGCNSDCLGTEGCTCPAGFVMQGSECINASECGCFVAEANLVIPSGETSVNEDCTQKCSCNNNRLICVDYICSTDAVCDVRNEIRQCYCNEGYEGNGETCESLYTDCQAVNDAGRGDGVYAIMPTGWQESPFNVHCKMHGDEGWTVFQRRTDDDTSFNQNWTAYKDGFGNSRNFRLGNEKLYYLTNQNPTKLRLDITTSDGTSLYAEFTEFQIESEDTKYKMNKLGSRTSPSGYAERCGHVAHLYLSYVVHKLTIMDVPYFAGYISLVTKEPFSNTTKTTTHAIPSTQRSTEAAGGTRIVGALLVIVIAIALISNTAAAASHLYFKTSTVYNGGEKDLL
ncbi:fibrinogen-like protein [Apostichopus japonicus]|uniref:Fibrinogen-like protein n=1 Tax=Stichopus japonicus TaxID=307972 RepID=A0A2G8JTD5_STIJA|nr:fibrinogen-like protein [Apostichopus japonicus]